MYRRNQTTASRGPGSDGGSDYVGCTRPSNKGVQIEGVHGGCGRTTPGCGAQAGSEWCILDASRSLESLQTRCESAATPWDLSI